MRLSFPDAAPADSANKVAADTAFILEHAPYNWVGMLHKEQQRINLVLPDGTLHPAFPLAGTTPYSLVKRENHRLMVVVGNGQRVYAYQILDVQ